MRLPYCNPIIFMCFLLVPQRIYTAELVGSMMLAQQEVIVELAEERTRLGMYANGLYLENHQLHQQNNTLREDLQKLQEQYNELHREYGKLFAAYKKICPATQDTPTVEKTLPEESKSSLEETKNSTLAYSTNRIDKHPSRKRLRPRQRITLTAFGKHVPRSFTYCILSPQKQNRLRRDDRDGC